MCPGATTMNGAEKDVKAQFFKPAPNPGKGISNAVFNIRPPGPPCNTPPEDRADPRTAGEILADSSWAVPISRPMVLAYNNPKEFGALLAWAAVRAWRDRGVHGKPPGGWALLAGTTPRNWQRWRTSAIELGLIAMRGTRINPLSRLEPHQQFARVPAEILFDQKLSRAAKRVFIGLSLYRSGFGDSRAAVVTLAKASSTHSRNVHKVLRELQNHCHITSMGAVGRGAVRYFLKGQTTPPASKSSTNEAPPSPKSYARNPQNGHQRHPPHGPKEDSTATPKLQKEDTTATPKRTPARTGCGTNETALANLARRHGQEIILRLDLRRLPNGDPVGRGVLGRCQPGGSQNLEGTNLGLCRPT